MNPLRAVPIPAYGPVYQEDLRKFPRPVPVTYDDRYGDPGMWAQPWCCDITSTGQLSPQQLRRSQSLVDRYYVVKNGVFSGELVIEYMWAGTAQYPRAVVYVPRNIRVTVFFYNSRVSQSASGQSIGIGFNDLKYGFDGFIVTAANTDVPVEFALMDGSFSREIVVSVVPCGESGRLF